LPEATKIQDLRNKLYRYLHKGNTILDFDMKYKPVWYIYEIRKFLQGGTDKRDSLNERN